MGDGPRATDARKVLGELLEAEALDDEPWLARIRRAREESGIPVFSELIRALTHLRFSESEAEARWLQILAHRRELARRLGRDIGPRIAAFDWFVNIDPRLRNPKVLELAQFERTEKSAMTDWLTGLYNRGAFRSSSLRELRRAQRYRQRLAFLFFDLDDFKVVNDQHGHETGDWVLREASRLLLRSVRDVDLCARHGGEEFAVLLPETGRDGAVAGAERVRLAIDRGLSVRGRGGAPVRITVSGGIAVYPEDGDDLGDLLRRADETLYRAKSMGKNRIVGELAERRLAERYAIDRPGVSLTLRRSGQPRSIRARPRDISRTGIGIRVAESIAVGQRVELNLAENGRQWPDLAGTVVRQAEVPEPAGPAAFVLGIGLEERCYSDAAAAIQTLCSERERGRAVEGNET
jgi:diguanylate cyclase (GGDEF)-like protein